jgi:hypothetical protein
MSDFRLDAKRWSRAHRITLIATVVLFVSLFLPWFTYDYGFGSISVDALWHGWMYVTLLISLAIIVYLVARGGFAEMPLELPVAEERLLLVGTGANAVLTVLAFAFKPGGIGLSGIGWGFGAIVGLVAAIVATLPYAVPEIQAVQARRAQTGPASPPGAPPPPGGPGPTA